MPELRILEKQPDDLRTHEGPFVFGNQKPLRAVTMLPLLPNAEFPIVGYTETIDPVITQWDKNGKMRLKGGARSDDDYWYNLFAAEEVQTEQEKYEELLRASRAVYTQVGNILANRGSKDFEAFTAAIANFD